MLDITSSKFDPLLEGADTLDELKFGFTFSDN